MYFSPSRSLFSRGTQRFTRSFNTVSPLILQVWGANTGVGKTVVSGGLLRARKSTSLYLKPIQTGYPVDDDASSVEQHAKNVEAVTLNKYKPPTSPDLAAFIENTSVPDHTLQHETKYVLQEFFSRNKDDAQMMALVETAGGVLSPCPSGTTQADVFRPLRLPALLVGDSKLGGISSTLAAYEALKIRGYSVPSIIMFANEGESLTNEKSVARNVDKDTETYLAPSLPPPEVPLQAYFESPSVSEFFMDLSHILEKDHESRFRALLHMKDDAKKVFWYPFTQHSQLSDVTCIDSAHGETFTCANKHGYYHLVDGIGSWWTNGVGHGNGKTARAIGAAAGRYGHVMFAEAVYEPAYEVSKRLLASVGAGWASRAFFSDNGSTAIEVALKMAFRKRTISAPERKNLPVKVIGLKGSYHGDTLGVMDCSEESDYNTMQTPWYEPRGVFFDPPTVSIKNGVWTLDAPEWIGSPDEIVFENRTDALSTDRKLPDYRIAIKRVLDSVMKREDSDLGALLIEPVLLGAGGMKLVDPAFQKALVSECRQLDIPVVFDEIFTGLGRLGCESGASLLNCNPDIAAYGKLLTGGTVPLSVTLASKDVFDAFEGSSKREALLHGHSYTAHAIGCAAAIESLNQYEVLAGDARGKLREYWTELDAREISTLENVDNVTCIGTVLAVELKSSEKGYASTTAMAVVTELLRTGVFARPLGNIVYVMCSPMSNEEHCKQVLAQLMASLESTSGDGAILFGQ